MKIVLCIIMMISLSLVSNAQTVAGKWKMTAAYTEDDGGKRMDLLKEMLTAEPCLAKVVYEFTGDQKIRVPKGQCPADPSEMGLGTKWKVKGNKITVSSEDNEIDPETYDLELTGNKMNWTIRYPGGSGVRLLRFEFVKG